MTDLVKRLRTKFRAKITDECADRIEELERQLANLETEFSKLEAERNDLGHKLAEADAALRKIVTILNLETFTEGDWDQIAEVAMNALKDKP